MKAWRGEPTSTAADESTKSVRFQGEGKEAAAADGKPGPKKNFFANLDNTDFNVNCLPEPPTYTEGGQQPDASL